MTLIKNTFFAAVIGSTALLAGCSSGPSESEMKSALIAQMDDSFGVLGALTGKKVDTSELIKEVINHGCKDVDNRDGYYQCDVEVTLKDPFSEKTKTSREMAVFYETKNGWVAGK